MCVNPHRTVREGVDCPNPLRDARDVWEEHRIRAAAGRTHGVLSRGALRTVGVTQREIAWRIGSGRLEVIHPGVYYLDSVVATWKTEVLAAVLAAGPDALASHRTAALLWRLDGIYGRILEVTVPFNEEPEPAGVLVHRTRRINSGQVLEGIPTTSPEKTLIDVASMLPERTLFKASRSAVTQHLTTAEKLDRAIGVHGGRGVSGTRKMRRVVALVDADQSGSPSEIDLKYIVMDAPIPGPVQQLRIRLPDTSHAYPDFAWPDRYRIVEVDGFGAHGTPQQLQRDLRRQNLLMELGWEIRRFTATEIRDQPQRVRSEIVRFVNAPFRAGLRTQSVH